jgi:hypothetical protein
MSARTSEQLVNGSLTDDVIFNNTTNGSENKINYSLFDHTDGVLNLDGAYQVLSRDICKIQRTIPYKIEINRLRYCIFHAIYFTDFTDFTDFRTINPNAVPQHKKVHSAFERFFGQS